LTDDHTDTDIHTDHQADDIDHLRVGGWVPSRNDSTATQQIAAVPGQGVATAARSLPPAPWEAPFGPGHESAGPLEPVRVDAPRRGRWWFAVVPVAVAVLVVAVVLQLSSGDHVPGPGLPPLSPVVALPESTSPSAPVNDPSASATPSTSSAAPRPATTPTRSVKPSQSATPTAPTAHRGAVVGIAGRCLAADRDRPELAVCDDRGSQRWSAPGDGTVRIQNRCLDVFASSEANGTPVILYPCNRSDAQQWQMRGDGTWRNPQSNKCLSAVGGRSQPGTRLAVFDCSGAAHQRWVLT
jgi:hypothetical protein